MSSNPIMHPQYFPLVEFCLVPDNYHYPLRFKILFPDLPHSPSTYTRLICPAKQQQQKMDFFNMPEPKKISLAKCGFSALVKRRQLADSRCMEQHDTKYCSGNDKLDLLYSVERAPI